MQETNEQMEENRFKNHRVFVMPNGLDKDNEDFMTGSIIILLGFGTMAGGRGRMELIEEPLNIPHSFDEKAGNILIHLLRFPTESEIKINYYVSSWYDTPEVLNSFFDKDYLEWFKDTVKSIPSVEVICKTLKTYPRKLPTAMINVLSWLLIGLREPKLTPITGESAKNVDKLFNGIKRLGRVLKIFKLECQAGVYVPRNDLLRYEYGYLGERMDNVYGFLYHFEAIGTYQFFVDKIQHAFLNTDFERSHWHGSKEKAPFRTLLVLEWTPSLARLFMNTDSLDIPSADDPNVYCAFTPSGMRIAYVITLESTVCSLIIPRNYLNWLNDGIIVGIAVSACFIVIRLVFHNLLWPLV